MEIIENKDFYIPEKFNQKPALRTDTEALYNDSLNTELLIIIYILRNTY